MTPYLMLADFMVSHIGAEILAGFRAPDDVHARFYLLLDKEKQGQASAEEVAEIDQFMHVERILQLAKARIRQHAV